MGLTYCGFIPSRVGDQDFLTCGSPSLPGVATTKTTIRPTLGKIRKPHKKQHLNGNNVYILNIFTEIFRPMVSYLSVPPAKVYYYLDSLVEVYE